MVIASFKSRLGAIVLGALCVLALGSTVGCRRSSPSAGGGTAAGGGAGEGQPAHCDTIATTSTCREYRPIAVQAAGQDSLRSLCGIGSGTFAMGACPTAGLVGTCDKPENIERYYSSGAMAFTAATAQAACAGGLTPGTFRAGP